MVLFVQYKEKVFIQQRVKYIFAFYYQGIFIKLFKDYFLMISSFQII